MGRRVPDRGSRTIWGSASGRRPLFPDVADEAEPLAGDCPDQPLILAAVADGLAGRVYVTGQCRFRDDAPLPYDVQEVVFADDVLPILHEIEQQVEDLRSEEGRGGKECGSTGRYGWEAET